MKHPTRDECEKILNEYGTPEHVKRHCRAVAAAAYAIGEAMNKNGCSLNLKLILAAGLLHDVARVEDKHWEVGADIMLKLGYVQEADIIKRHMKYDFSDDGEINETDLVCLGDRLVMEDEYVGLDVRIDYIIAKAARNGHPEAKPIILRKKEETKALMKRIEQIIGCSVDQLMKGKS